MKKTLLLAALFAASSSIFADEWQAPVYSGSFLPLTTEEPVYIYNTEAKQFLNEGNDWGTHATVADTGLEFTVSQYVPTDGGEWDGASYTLATYSNTKKGNYIMFFDAGGHIYVDGSTSKTDFLFSFKDLGNNTYNIVGSEANPTYKNSGEEYANYLIGRDVNYNNSRDGIQTGTGVIYDYVGTDSNYGEGEFQTTWAFVSKESYDAYVAQIATYKKALELGEALKEAAAIDLTDVADEKAVYENTSSSLEDIEEAISSLSKKILNQYEVVITPDTPKVIEEDACDAISSWTNGINATTWNTQTWIDESWQGFEGTTLNIWGSKTTGKAYKTLSDMPNGIYVISMAVYSQNLAGYAFANENTKSVSAGAAGNVYSVTTEVTDGNLTYGFGQEEEGTNWIAIDNVLVKYYGAGTEAYRYWLNGLLQSAPSFDDVLVQTDLVTEYEKVLGSVNTAQTKEEILDIIPAYEGILNRININIKAYETLDKAVSDAQDMSADENINNYYGELLSDEALNMNDNVIGELKANTEEVNEYTKTLQGYIDEAQNYLWNIEKLSSEMDNAADIYTEYKDKCSSQHAQDYDDFLKKYNDLVYDNLKNADVEKLLKEIYAIEFNLQIPVEEASEDNPIDYTAKIAYPSFDNGAEGWTNDGWGTCGYNSWNPTDGVLMDANYLNLWNESAATVSQTITGLPAGKYVFSLSAFSDAEGLQIFANNDYLDVVVGKTSEGTAYIYDGSENPEPYASESSIWYGNQYRVTAIVGEDGTLNIGVRSVSSSAVWAMIDNAKLTYYGKSSTSATEVTINDITALIDDYLNGKDGVSINDITTLIDKYLAQ